ncbi:MAG: hypothetical protein SRB2_02467 [Desulfobacteraceae bacterium Eth-SRB2]|nr:MAG: hypothetical protein SRB2_02467 [Desulfobacteraceae bacterium Eth-SRB2]
MTGRNRRMCGENGGVFHLFHGLGIRHTSDYTVTDAFQNRKNGMPFVKMHQMMFDSQNFQNFGAADTQNDFLAQSLLHVPDVKTGRYAPVPRVVVLDIRIQKIQGDTSDVYFPDAHMDCRINEGNPNHKLPTLIIKYPGNRCGVSVDGFMNIFLPAVFANLLMKIPLGIHETYGHQGNT